MALDPLERDRLRQKMATRMATFLENAPTVGCISGHFYEEPHLCDLCQETHADEILVIKNRAGKKLRVAVPCLKEMVRFKVTDVDDLARWLEKISLLRDEADRRKTEREQARQEERKRLEKKVIVRKRPAPEETL